MHVRRDVRFRSLRSGHHNYADRLLHSLKDARVHFWLVALGGAVDDPDVVACTSHVVAHLLESRSSEKSRDSDETDDSCIVRGLMIKDLPCRPAPKVDIEVAKMFAMSPGMPFGRRHPGLEWWRVFLVRARMLNPAPATHRLFLIGRIAQNYSDRLLALNLVRVAPRSTKSRKHAGEIVLVLVGIAQRVGHADAQWRVGRGTGKVDHFGEEAQLGYREWAELHFEPYQA